MRIDSAITAKVPAHAVGVVDVRVSVGTATSAASSRDQFICHNPAPAGANLTVGTYTSGVVIGQTGGVCRPIQVTTAGFTNTVTCRFTGSSQGIVGSVWTQGPESVYNVPYVFAGTWITVTCDGVSTTKTF